MTALCLGIESSCDDTAAAVVAADRTILSSVVFGQDALHRDFGGVVPEIAARAHAERVDHSVADALGQAGQRLSDIDLIAVTAGPGLIGGVLAGVMCAKGLAAASGTPILGVNHLAGHALTPRLTDGLEFPYLMLLISGGHCQFLAVLGPQGFVRLGGTIDDAPGEAFDKTARLLGFGMPGGPAVERAAADGDPGRVPLPRPLLDRAGCDLSFSGLKTAVRRAVEQAEAKGLTDQDRSDIAAGFQAAVAEILAEKSRRAIAAFGARWQPATVRFAVAGGVAANRAIGGALRQVAEEAGARFVAPPASLCTDNGAVIAWAGLEQGDDGMRDDLGFAARPRWPLDTAAAPILGGGRKGAKA